MAAAMSYLYTDMKLMSRKIILSASWQLTVRTRGTKEQIGGILVLEARGRPAVKESSRRPAPYLLAITS
jgi:hypothetical protein